LKAGALGAKTVLVGRSFSHGLSITGRLLAQGHERKGIPEKLDSILSYVVGPECMNRLDILSKYYGLVPHPPASNHAKSTRGSMTEDVSLQAHSENDTSGTTKSVFTIARSKENRSQFAAEVIEQKPVSTESTLVLSGE
jgi:hypothetical protein